MRRLTHVVAGDDDKSWGEKESESEMRSNMELVHHNIDVVFLCRNITYPLDADLHSLKK